MEQGFDVFKFLTSQAGILASCSIALNLGLGYFVKLILTNNRVDIKEAFKQAKECAEQRHVDGMLFQATLAENTKMLAVISTQLQTDRRSHSR